MNGREGGIAKSVSQGFQSGFCALAVPAFCSGENAFVIGLSGREHVVNDSGQLVRGGGDCFGSPEPGSHATVELAQS